MKICIEKNIHIHSLTYMLENENEFEHKLRVI